MAYYLVHPALILWIVCGCAWKWFISSHIASLFTLNKNHLHQWYIYFLLCFSKITEANHRWDNLAEVMVLIKEAQLTDHLPLTNPKFRNSWHLFIVLDLRLSRRADDRGHALLIAIWMVRAILLLPCSSLMPFEQPANILVLWSSVNIITMYTWIAPADVHLLSNLLCAEDGCHKRDSATPS